MDTLLPSTPSPDHLWFEQLRQEHTALRRLLEEIAVLLAARSGETEQAAALLGQLGDRLVKHFALEESDGYFGEALLQAPRLVSRANDLLDQHPKMAAAAKFLGEAPDLAEASRQWWDETERRFRAFALELLEHERSEDRLLQEAYSLDMQAGD